MKSLSCVRLLATPWTAQPTRLLRPWDFPGNSTGVGCHCLLRDIRGKGKGNSCFKPYIFRPPPTTVISQEGTTGISLVVQWLRLCSPNAGGLGLIPGQGTRSHRLQLRVLTSQLNRHEIAKLTGSQEEGEGGREGCSFLAISALPFSYHRC